MVKTSPIFRQIITLVCCHLASLSYGLISGWASINFVDFQNENTTLPAGQLTLAEATLVTSLSQFGVLIGNLMIFPIIERFGIKRSIHCICIPLILSSLLIILGPNVYYLYVAKILSGLSCGCVRIGTLNLSMDIASDSVRGVLISIFEPAFISGVLLSYLFGNFLNCADQAKIQLIPSVIFGLALFFIPETPQYYIKRNNKIQAIKSEKFFRGMHSATEKIDVFMEQVGVVRNVMDTDKLTLSDFSTPHAKRSILLATAFLPCAMICGVYGITSYATAVFTETGSSLSVKMSTLLIPIVQLSTHLVFINIVDRFNRKLLFVSTSILLAIVYFLFGLYCMAWTNTPNLEWIPPLSVLLLISVGSLGIIPIPHIIAMEIYPLKIRNACASVSMAYVSIILFSFLTAFPLVEAAIGLSTCLFGFGVICALYGLFGLWLLPETRGKSIDEIKKSLGG